jgi:hypothetical protein
VSVVGRKKGDEIARSREFGWIVDRKPRRGRLAR